MGGTALQAAENPREATMVAYLYPIPAAASPPEYQYTRARRVAGWESYHTPPKSAQRL